MMSMTYHANKAETILNYFKTCTNPTIEIYVEGIGWLILMRDNIEIVSDNWFSSTKFIASEIEISEETPAIISCKNVYKKNATYNENANNSKYNLHFDVLNIFTDQIVAYF